MDHSDQRMELHNLRNLLKLRDTATSKDIKESFSRGECRYLEIENDTMSRRRHMKAEEERISVEFNRVRVAYALFIAGGGFSERLKQHLITMLRLPQTASLEAIKERFNQVEARFYEMQKEARAKHRKQDVLEAQLSQIKAHLNNVKASYLKCKDLIDNVLDSMGGEGEKKPLPPGKKDAKDRRKKVKAEKERLENLIATLRDALPDLTFLRDIQTIFEVLDSFFGSKDSLINLCGDIEKLNKLCSVVEAFIEGVGTLYTCIQPITECSQVLSHTIMKLQLLAKSIASIDLEPVPHVQLPPSHVSSEPPPSHVSSREKNTEDMKDGDEVEKRSNLGSVTYVLGPEHVLALRKGPIITYYEGILHFNVVGKVDEQGCFMVFKDLKDALKIYDYVMKTSCEQVHRPRLYFYDGMKFHVILYHYFVGSNSKEGYGFVNQNMSGNIKGHPKSRFQDDLKTLMGTVDHLRKMKVFSSGINQAGGFVFCPNDNKLKILIVDKEWKEGNFEECMASVQEGVAEVFFQTSVNDLKKKIQKKDGESTNRATWEPKDLFLECFTDQRIKPFKRLRMLGHHPILMSKEADFARFFMDVHHAVTLGINYLGENLDIFYKKLRKGGYGKQFLVNKKWSRVGSWSVKFQKIFEHKYDVDGEGRYDDECFKHLIRFLRNGFVHHVKKHPNQVDANLQQQKKGDANLMTVKEYLQEIEKNWPNLIYVLFAEIFMDDYARNH